MSNMKCRTVFVPMLRRSKYGNKKKTTNGIVFDSLKEERRYRELKLMEKAGLIHFLRVHPRYVIMVNGEKICVYVGDFEYVDEFGKTIVEDVKGVRTRDYILKRKLMFAVFNVRVREI